jgi:hypothetical protein
MSAGAPHHGPIDADRERELRTLLDDPVFAAAVRAYDREDSSHDIPYVGGSATDWRTVFWDRLFAAAVLAGKFKIAGRSEDPRPTGKVHEAVEGAIIHLWDLCRQLLGWPQETDKYDRAHDIATIAEQHAVAHKGWPWLEYQAAWKPFVRIDEREKITNPPRNLLLEPYRGTPLFAKLQAFQGKPEGAPMQMNPRQKFDALIAARAGAQPGGGPAMASPVASPRSPPPMAGPMPAPDVAPPMAPPMLAGPALPVAHKLAHGRAIAGANALHAVGHISEAQRDKHVNASMRAIGKKPEAPRKPFGSFAPVGGV